MQCAQKADSDHTGAVGRSEQSRGAENNNKNLAGSLLRRKYPRVDTSAFYK